MLLLKYLIKISPNVTSFILSCMVFCLRKYHLATVPRTIRGERSVNITRSFIDLTENII